MITPILTLSPEIEERASKIKVLLMDVDGVMTDGTLYYVPGADGQMVEVKGFNSQDGLGLHFCYAVGLQTGIISGRESPALVERARILNICYVYQGHLDKIASYEQILKDASVSDQNVAFIGDDLTDVPVMKRSGLAVAVANAREEVKGAAHYVTLASGGQGAVREVIEIILKAQGVWDSVLDKYRLSAQTIS